MHINTERLAKNLNYVKDLLITIRKNPGIIAISKIKLRDGGFHDVGLEGFDFVHHNLPTKAGGVGLYAGPQRENFPGGTKIDTGPPNLIEPSSPIGAHAVKLVFVEWV